MPQTGGTLTPRNIRFLDYVTHTLGPTSLHPRILITALRKQPFNKHLTTVQVEKIEAKKNICNVYKNTNLFLIYNHFVQQNVQQ